MPLSQLANNSSASQTSPIKGTKDAQTEHQTDPQVVPSIIMICIIMSERTYALRHGPEAH